MNHRNYGDNLDETVFVTRVVLHPPQAYLDMARALAYSRITPAGVSPNNAELGRIACTYIFSYAAIEAFVGERLHDLWSNQESKVWKEFGHECESFQDL